MGWRKDHNLSSLNALMWLSVHALWCNPWPMIGLKSSDSAPYFLQRKPKSMNCWHRLNISSRLVFLGLSTDTTTTSTSNFLMTFSEFLIFQRKCRSALDFICFLKFSDFWKGGVFENSWKSRNRPKSKHKCWFIAIKGASRNRSAREVLILALKKIHAYWISALQPSHIR